ncbi:Uncharacterised protein [uncultured archaeon]|nr:Uncharacterised protein [uncultured archaeon]
MLLLNIGLYIILLCIVGSSIAASDSVLANDIKNLLVSPQGEYYAQILPKSDGNFLTTSFNMSSVQSMAFFGWNPNTVGAAVKFKPPSNGWNLKKIQVVGWNYFDPKNETHPEEKIFALEIRDSKLKLLYKITDSRLNYFQSGEPSMATIEIPPIPMSDEFYIIFYDRGGVAVGTNVTAPQDTSYFYNSLADQMLPAKLTLNGQEASLNWIIRAVGTK